MTFLLLPCKAYHSEIRKAASHGGKDRGLLSFPGRPLFLLKQNAVEMTCCLEHWVVFSANTRIAKTKWLHFSWNYCGIVSVTQDASTYEIFGILLFQWWGYLDLKDLQPTVSRKITDKGNMLLGGGVLKMPLWILSSFSAFALSIICIYNLNPIRFLEKKETRKKFF